MSGMFIGFLMCIPVGPINILVINTHLKKSAKRALAIAFGGSIMDIIYFYIILSGLSFLDMSENVTFYLKGSGICLIFLLGFKEMIHKNIEMIETVKRETPSGIIKGIVLGIIIYTSNPALILTMTALGAFVKSLELFSFGQVNIVLLSLGLGIGSFSWFVFLVKIVDRYKETIRNRYLNILNKVSGVLMIGLSLFMGYRLCS